MLGERQSFAVDCASCMAPAALPLVIREGTVETTRNRPKSGTVRQNVLATVSHDLRSSLNAITLSTGQLRRSAGDRGRVHIIAERIERAARSMLDAIERLDDHRRTGARRRSSRVVNVG